MIVAVDTGGTKTLVAVFDTDGLVVAKEKFPTPPDISDYITQLSQTVDRLTQDTAITCLAVALPGDIVNGVMRWAGNLDWRGVDIKAMLTPHYTCPIIVENDANLAGLAEARGLQTIPEVCLYLTVSTGIGTGVILNGALHPQLSRTEGGRMILRRDNGYTMWELFASGKAIHAKYGKLASEIDDDETWNAIADNIAQGLFAICPFLRPDVVVLGGGVGNYFERFSERLQQLLSEKFHDSYLPQLVKAAHPEEAVIYGCYYYALDVAAA